MFRAWALALRLDFRAQGHYALVDGRGRRGLLELLRLFTSLAETVKTLLTFLLGLLCADLARRKLLISSAMDEATVPVFFLVKSANAVEYEHRLKVAEPTHRLV